MWVDVERKDRSTQFHWSAESSTLDLFLLLSKTPKGVSKQLADLTGKPAMPQEFAVAYHQCRWNYNDEEDVFDTNQKFDEYDIPYDVLWLDIEHTDQKKYFTWDQKKFSDPTKMLNNLAITGRKVFVFIYYSI